MVGMRDLICVVEGYTPVQKVIYEASVIRLGWNYIRKLTNQAQLLSLLQKHAAMRGWTTSDGDVWVLDAEAMSHMFAARHIPQAERPIYFWHPSDAPDVEFEQNGGRNNVLDCGEFLFDVIYPFGSDPITDTINRCPTLARIIPGHAVKAMRDLPRRLR